MDQMPSEVGAQFRDAERQLDDALRRDRATITASGIEVIDDSARTSHYKNGYVSWSLRFESRCARGSEVEKVWGTVSVHEVDPTIAKVWRRAEIFQIGAHPRWEKTDEREMPLQSLLRDGLATTVIQEFAEGKAAARSAG
jgi:hypothetical protein